MNLSCDLLGGETEILKNRDTHVAERDIEIFEQQTARPGGTWLKSQHQQCYVYGRIDHLQQKVTLEDLAWRNERSCLTLRLLFFTF